MSDAPLEGKGLFTVSAPSGAGKTSLVAALVRDNSDVAVAVSHTTRAMRAGEQHGRDYYFVSVARFEEMLEADEFLEHATVFGNRYGTSRQQVLDRLRAGQRVILEIDWQGAAQVRRKMPGCESIFILPPSRDELRTRLLNRGQDAEQVIEQRMAQAVQEMSHYGEADHLVVNDDFAAALNELQQVLDGRPANLSTRREHYRVLLRELLSG